MSSLTDYEQQRLERIAKNQELLASLNLERTVSRDATPDIKVAKAKKPAKPKAPRKALTDRIGEPVHATRSTRASLARTVALESKDPAAAKRKREEEDRMEAELAEARKRAKHGDREIEAWNPTGKHIIPEALVLLKRSLESIASTGIWPKPLHATIKSGIMISPASKRLTPRRGRVKKEEPEDDVRLNGGGGQAIKADEEEDKESISLESLRKTFETMSMRAVKRITPDRIYSLAVHPTIYKDLVFIGDRKGWLGIWDASADAEDLTHGIEKEEDELDVNAFVQRVYHDHGTISCLRLDPIKAHTIYASSYDCTIRSLNFETGVWREEVDVDYFAAAEDGEGEALVSAFDLTHNGNLIWVSDNRGGVLHADLREPKTKGRRWKLAESKIGCISVNPVNQDYFVTAHLNHDVRIWDARKVKSLDTSSSYDDAYDEACVVSFDNARACSSAYWDPSGRSLLSTSYDDALRVWNVDPSDLTETALGDFKPAVKVKHDTDTGAYTTVFKAVWSSNPVVDAYFTIGNMRKSLDVYSRDGKLIKKLDNGFGTIPAVTCGHPSKPVLFGGAAGGKVYYLKADNWR